MSNFFKGLKFLRAVDVLVILFTNFLSVLTLIFSFGSALSVSIIAVNIAAAFLIIAVARANASQQNKFIRAVYDWYPVPAIFFIFKEVYYTIQAISGRDWDSFFIVADRAVFGADPTVWLMKFASPVLTEVLQLSYTSYYFIMLAVGIELYVKNEREKYLAAVFTVVYGFVLSYFGYLSFPAVGPRFTLHDFNAINSELPGVWLTNSIRGLINMGESIPDGAANAIAVAQRDVFPSGHTQMTLITMYFAWKYRLKVRYAIHIFGTLLIISTVYLRYHYVVDLFGGMLFMFFTLWSAPRLLAYWSSIGNGKVRISP